MARKSALITVMEQAARKAAVRLIRDFNDVENLQVSKKGPADFVSKADLRAEKVLTEELHRVRPKFGFLCEEGDPIIGEEEGTRWIIDPLDGTTNFLHGIPHFAISIALERDGQIVAGVILDPTRDEMFWAEKGQGAFLNSRRLRVSGRRSLEASVLATGIPHMGRKFREEFSLELNALMPRVAGIRRMGSAALDMAYVAAGRYDGYWERGLSAWDIAAGVVIVREAGGMVSDFSGRSGLPADGHIVAANPTLHTPLLKVLRQAVADRKN